MQHMIIKGQLKMIKQNLMWHNQIQEDSIGHMITSIIKDFGSISRALKTWFLPIVNFPSQLPKFFSNERSSELDFISSDPKRTWKKKKRAKRCHNDIYIQMYITMEKKNI